MRSLLLLLLVGTTFAQESGDYAEETSHQLMTPANEEDNNLDESIDEAYDKDEYDEKDSSLSQESDRIEPDATAKIEDAVCPKTGVCVYHFFYSLRTFHSAQSACRCWSGNLSSIHNWRTNIFLRKFLRKVCRNSSYVWIGVWKRNTCYPYRNIDGSRLNYTNWGCGQRRSYGRWCTAMNTNSGQWVSLRCNTRLPYVCTY